jgi:hypothetical protein
MVAQELKTIDNTSRQRIFLICRNIFTNGPATK